tara:strand:- start:511 stop:1074 length:564 start_codon:yes stop_codon:yes gene_type:complete
MANKIHIPFCFTSPEAKEIYNNKPPQYETKGSSGFDLRAIGYDFSHIIHKDSSHKDCIATGIIQKDYPIVLVPNERVLINTGIRVILPYITQIYELQIRSRSGLTLKQGLVVANGIGTIDNDYIGEIGIILRNISSKTQTINICDRIAQGVLNPLQQVEFIEYPQEEFDKNFCKTNRGLQGFGSTGI